MNKSAFYLFLVLLALAGACKNPANKNSALVTDPVYKMDPQLKKITDQIAAKPDDATLFFKRGNLLHRMQMDSLAIKDYKMASSLDTNKAEYLSAVGELLFENKDLTGAVNWIQKAIAKDPTDQKARLKIAKALLYIRQYPAAFQQINIVMEKSPHEPEAYFLKGMIYKDMKDTARALSNFLTAVSVSPEYREGYIQLGLLYSDKRDPVALKYLEDAFHLDSTNVFPLFAQGVFYQQAGNLTAAKEKFRECILRNQHYVDAYFHMGYILRSQDSFEKAYHQYDIATKVDYLNPAAYYNRGVCNEDRDSLRLAIADYRKAMQMDTAYQSPRLALQRLAQEHKLGGGK